MIDINNRHDIFAKLRTLKKDDLPIFGKMTAQHMVEHLAFTINFSNGNNPKPQLVDTEKAAKAKELIIYTDKEILPGFKTPLMGDTPPPLKHSSLEDAIEALKKELTDFDKYYFDNKHKREINPILGELNYDEWLIFHNKHFTHHFRQFNIL